MEKTKTYSVMVGYDQILYTDIKGRLKEAEINPTILTDSYFYIDCATLEEVAKIGDTVNGTKFEFTKNGKKIVYKLRYFATYRQGTMFKKVKPVNTENEKAVKHNKAKLTRKLQNFNKSKKTGAQGINAKAKRKGVHSCPNNLSSFERKTLANVKKACKFIAKTESNKKKSNEAKKTKTTAFKQPKQFKLPLAA